MKKFALLAMLAGGMFLSSSGCATPAYSAQERGQLIVRNWGWEYDQIQDDVDELFLLRPAGHLSQWNLQ